MSIRRLLIAAASLTLILGLAGCRSINATATSPPTDPAVGDAIAAGEEQMDVTPDLGPEDAAALTFLREEEKLAHDVYVTLAGLWDAPIFSTIADSETSHTEAVARLLDQHDLPDPAAGAAVGVFSDRTLQELYAGLVQRGSESLVAALRVGAYIEEMDILDLREKASDVGAIGRVLANLERGSSNHLRAFVRNLETSGEPYEPQFLTDEEYRRIVDGETASGGNRTSVRRRDHRGRRADL
jgi:hypothetical protein